MQKLCRKASKAEGSKTWKIITVALRNNNGSQSNPVSDIQKCDD